jgi:ankyrin repeat protein
MAEALLAAGADPSVKNDEGLTAEDMAVKSGALKVVESLRSHRQGAAAG